MTAAGNDPPVTAVILAGGRGTRMGGAAKGLQVFQGMPLVQNALERLRRQSRPPARLIINANQDLAAYAAFGVPVVPDTGPDFAGPLAGFLAGLVHCQTPLLLTVPCDVPLFPLTLCERLAQALIDEHAEIAMAAAPGIDDAGNTIVRTQPVFCLLRRERQASLAAFLQGGERKASVWAARHRQAIVPFDQPGDEPHAFANANTFAELRALEPLAQPQTASANGVRSRRYHP